MSTTINIGQQPNFPRYPGGGMPGYAFPGGMPGFPGGGFPGNGPGGVNISIGEGGPGNSGEGGKCCGKKKEKDRGIIGDILTGLFGEDSVIGRMVDGRGKRCGRHHHHGGDQGSGATNININMSDRSQGLGF